MNKKVMVLLLLTGFAMLSGCYYYDPGPYVVASPAPYPSYDYIFDSAMRAAQDAGIQVTSSNRNNGTIFGERNGTTVTIQVMQQADGRTRVELSAKGAQTGSSTVADDFYRAYDHYMGRR
jgi:hypothetical protein